MDIDQTIKFFQYLRRTKRLLGFEGQGWKIKGQRLAGTIKISKLAINTALP